MKLLTWVSSLMWLCSLRSSATTERREVWGDGDTEFTLGHNEFEVLVTHLSGNTKLALGTVDLVLMI